MSNSRRFIGLYFCTYDDADFISSYAKVCVRYGIFLYIRLQYVPGDCPGMSRGGKLVPCCAATLILTNEFSQKYWPKQELK